MRDPQPLGVKMPHTSKTHIVPPPENPDMHLAVVYGTAGDPASRSDFCASAYALQLGAVLFVSSSSHGLVGLGLVRFLFRFNYPADVALGPNGTLFVADLHSLRRISMPENPTDVLGVGFDGRVSTAAGGSEPGEADGIGPEVCRMFLSRLIEKNWCSPETTAGWLEKSNWIVMFACTRPSSASREVFPCIPGGLRAGSHACHK